MSKVSDFKTEQVHWEPISLTVGELWSLAKRQRLILRPDFQRRAVWSEDAQKNLIDTILKNLPMPKIFFATEEIAESDLLRRVIDGQQRLTAIFHFLENRFTINIENSPLEQYYRELSSEIQERITHYRIDGNDIYCDDESIIRKIYSRVNKYNIALNRQELRKADFPGDFLDEAEILADLEFFDESRIFTAMQRRRMLDVEFTSELLVIVLEGIQDKKEKLDLYCQKYQYWEKSDRARARHSFESVIKRIDQLFSNCEIKLSSTRFRQKSDFYSLFAAMLGIAPVESTDSGMDWDPLALDLKILDKYIAPESPIDLLSNYAVKCVSDANSISSRRWRIALIKSFLKPTLSNSSPDAEDVARFAQIRLQLPSGYMSESASTEEGSLVNLDLFDLSDAEQFWVGWPRGVLPMQMSNMVFISHTRYDAKSHKYQNCFNLNEIALEYFVTYDV